MHRLACIIAKYMLVMLRQHSPARLLQTSLSETTCAHRHKLVPAADRQHNPAARGQHRAHTSGEVLRLRPHSEWSASRRNRRHITLTARDMYVYNVAYSHVNMTACAASGLDIHLDHARKPSRCAQQTRYLDLPLLASRQGAMGWRRQYHLLCW